MSLSLVAVYSLSPPTTSQSPCVSLPVAQSLPTRMPPSRTARPCVARCHPRNTRRSTGENPTASKTPARVSLTNAFSQSNEIADLDAPLGWTRGLRVLDENRLIIGASTLRVTSIRNNIRWVKKKFGQMESDKVTPTNIALYILAEKRVEWVMVLDDPMVDVVFSVL